MTTTDTSPLAERTPAALPGATTARWGAWMLAVSPAYFVLVVVANVGVLTANRIGLFEDITRAQMDALGFGWVLVNALFPLAFILGGVAIALLGASLARRGIARGWSWSAVITALLGVLLYLPYAPFRIAAMGFTEERLGDNALYTVWDPMGYAGNYLAIAATVLVCVALFVGTPHRRAGLVIGGLTLVYLIAAIAQLPLPPFVISFLWCALGIVWLRRIRTTHPASLSERMITAAPSAPMVRADPAAAVRVVGIVLVALAASWGIVGIVLFAQGARGEASTLLLLDPRETDAALAALGWSPPVVFTVIVTVQTAALVTTIFAAAFILATPRPSAYTTALAVVIILFVATASCAVQGWMTALPASSSVVYYLTALASVAFLALAPLFPTGTAVPRWSAAVVVGWALLGALSLLVPWWTLGTGWVAAGSIAAVALVVVTIVAQAIRYRRHADRTQRQQVKWVVLSLGLYLLSLVPVLATPPGAIDAMSGPAGVAFQIIRGLVSALLFALIAVSLAFAIAKYRLFDVDLVIRRTVVATALVVLVGLLYVAAVGGAALLWQGSGVPAAIVATIVVAFAAHPVRMRLERAVERWVYGARGDPYAVVSRLSDELRDLSGTAEIADHVAELVVRDLRYSGASVIVAMTEGERKFARGHAATRIVARRPLTHDGEVVGELVVRADAGDKVSAAHGRLVDSVAAQTGLALGAARAAEEVRASRERILLAREEERRRLYRDLHDGLGPGLAGARQRIDTAVRLRETNPQASRRLLEDASGAMADMLADVRSLVHGLRPPALDELGLSEAVLRASRPLDAQGMPRLAVGTAPRDLPPAVEVAAYRIAVEAITNASRHAGAHTISARFVVDGDLLVVTIEDDGCGIQDAPAGAGRRSMRERAEELGGRLRIADRRSGGTRVRAELPLPAELHS